MAGFSEDSQLSARPDVASCGLEDGAALLDMRSGVYYSMNPVASCIWDRIQAPASLKEIFAAVEARFEIAGRDYRADVLRLLAELIEIDLVELRAASSFAD